MSKKTALTSTSLPLSLVARGKVRDVYDAGIIEGQHRGALLFVATDRISAFDIILENVRFISISTRLLMIISSPSPTLVTVN